MQSTQRARQLGWITEPLLESGPHNAITDVPGIYVGHYTGEHLTGTTVILANPSAVGGICQRGGSPGTRETDLLNPVNRVDIVNAIVLSGGSAYSTSCASNVGSGFPGWPSCWTYRKARYATTCVPSKKQAS